MTVSDLVMIAAVLVGPILAVQVQQWIERAREYRKRQLNVFATLAATRAERVSREHVQALNTIDIVFHGRRIMGIWRWQSTSERRVVDAWSLYRDHLNHHPEVAHSTPGSDGLADSDDRQQTQTQLWISDGDRLFVDLLFEMSRCARFDFDKTMLKRGIYRPQAHGTRELFDSVILSGMADLLSGERSLKVVLPATDEEKAEWARVRKGLAVFLDNASRSDAPPSDASHERV